jgi:hypothetical protein
MGLLSFRRIAMPSTSQRYPLSTPDGIAIPLDVIRPHSFLAKTTALVVSAPVAIPSAVEIASFTATEDCLVCFGDTAIIAADGVLQPDTIFIQKGARVTVAPTASTFTVIAMSTPGYLYCQFIDKWAGLALETQYRKR